MPNKPRIFLVSSDPGGANEIFAFYNYFIQKDDFKIFIRNKISKDVQKFGSRSEQRLSILWLKMNEILFYEKNQNKKPILLFDDVFSEFDYKNKKLVINLFKKYQTIATTTDIEILQLAEIPKSIIKLV